MFYYYLDFFRYCMYNYIDNCISSYFEKYDFYKYYDMLQYINILRILPYVKEQKVYERICEILDSIKL